MANFTYIENAHVFSKAPVQLNMEASSAVNKSVHTVQSNEIWGEVCPFITRETVKDLEEDTLFELDGYAPVKFNYKKPAIVLDAINNNGMKSNGYVAKVIIDSKPITQFIADTDVTDATGKLASGYRAVLYDKTGGEVADSKYTINYSNGLIYFKEPIESTLNSHYTLSFFTYEGVKLDTTIADIKADVIENANNHSELSEKVDNIEDDYKEADIEINNNISNLSSKVADNKEKLQIAEANIENFDDRLIVIEENILDLDENISKLDSTVSSDLSDHINKSEIHVSEEDRELWNKGGNMTITGDNFIIPEKTDAGWSLNLNNSTVISTSATSNIDGNKKVPTENAVKNYVDNVVDEHKKDTIGTELSTWDIETAFDDGATNVFYFKCDSPFTGILTEVRLYCSPKSVAGEESYLEIRQNDKILARSTSAQYHSTYNLLKFNFDNILLKLGDRYGFYIVDKNGSTPSQSCLALKPKNSVPEVTNLNVEVNDPYSNYTPRFGFTYYKSNREIINNTLNKLNSDLVYDISYKYSKLNNITNVTNRTITFVDDSKIDFPINKITHGKYAFRTKSNTTSPLTEFNLRIIDGGKPGSGYDSAYYYERDVRNSSYDEDVGGNLETLGNLINGDGMFIRTGITVFNDDLSCLIRARQMFTNSSLTTFRSALPSLTFADRMFLGTDLTEFKVKLPNLSSAECMFRLCENLKFVDTCFPNLTFAQGMFGLCNNLERVDLSASSGSNLYLADDMFAGCEKLKTVKINLSYLENAKNMFGPANNKVASILDIESVKYIADTIKDWNNDYYSDRVHELSLGIDLIHADYETSSYKQYIEQIADKNWKVTVYTSDSRNNPAFIVVK